MLKVGMFIQNRYEIISRIGSGGMADVYKAKDHKLNRFVAVKVLKKEFREDKVFISKFRVEAQSAAGLAHANIVNIYDVGEEAGIYYIVMELIEGITLKGYIEKKGHLSVRETTSIALQISAGLEAAHNNGIIHRDVKPQNIIISIDGKVKVADFGIARASTSNTINSSVMGSVHYSSPEQSRGGYSDEKSDIYSLGITMYEMLTGHVPFDGDTAVAVAIKHLQEELRGPREMFQEIPYSTNQIVIKCTQKSPDRRYSNMSELIRDLRESLVNPEGDFVRIQTVDTKSKTIIMSKEEVDQINAERHNPVNQNNMPKYDESLDVGAAANLNAQPLKTAEENRAYKPGSYYQKSAYQEVVKPGGRRTPAGDAEEAEESADMDSSYDIYDDRDDYGFQESSYELDKSFENEDLGPDSDYDINPKLEKAVTVGGTIVAVVLGCVFLALIANAFGLLDFAKKGGNKKPAATVTEQQTEKKEDITIIETSTEHTTEKKTEKAEEPSTEAAAGSDIIVVGEPETEKITEAPQTEPPTTDIILENLTGMEHGEAEMYLDSKGLVYTLDQTQYDDNVAKGNIIRTEPGAGNILQPGDSVTLYVCQGSTADVVYVTVPDFWYCDEPTSTARCQLTGMGEPIYEYEPSRDVQKNWVTRQSIEKGTRVPAGTVITLYLSDGTYPSEDTAVENSDEVWECYAALNPPAGYAGEQVRIDLEQGGMTTTLFQGYTDFPYTLQVQGVTGEATGTAYVYILDGQGQELSKIEYPGIAFSPSN